MDRVDFGVIPIHFRNELVFCFHRLFAYFHRWVSKLELFHLLFVVLFVIMFWIPSIVF